MTTKRIIYTRPDGGVSIIGPAPEFIAGFDGTEDEALAFIQAKDVPADAVDAVQVDETIIPTDRTYRNAWRQAGGNISVDMPAARVIHANHIEAAKRKLARDLIEREMMGENVTAEKTALRAIDVGAEITAAQTTDSLKDAWPMALGER